MRENKIKTRRKKSLSKFRDNVFVIRAQRKGFFCVSQSRKELKI